MSAAFETSIPRKRVVLFLGLSSLFIVLIFYGYQVLYTPNILVDREDRVFIIKPGANFDEVRKNLFEGGFLNDAVSFSFLARLRGYDEHIRDGRYRLRRNMTNMQAIRTLYSGLQEPVRITFSHARKLSDLGGPITKNLLMSDDEFYAALYTFLHAHAQEYNADNALCLFIPNTYEVYYNVKPIRLIERIYQEYIRFWTPKRRRQAGALGLSPVEVSILASIVQGETIRADEAPIVARLYLNRLKMGMLLQADPTLVYAVGNFSLKRVLNVHKKIDSPYNTYVYQGLPPGPINMPSVASIDAALNPDQNDYIYMCAREDFSGYHRFTSTLRQHNMNATRYQRALTMKLRKDKASRKP